MPCFQIILFIAREANLQKLDHFLSVQQEWVIDFSSLLTLLLGSRYLFSRSVTGWKAHSVPISNFAV